jgi:hypothetical protein
MRRFALSVTALCLLACSGLLEGVAEQAENNPAFAESFTKSFVEQFTTSCAKEATNVPADQAQALCGCVGARLASRHKPSELVTLLTRLDSPEFDAEVKADFEACANGG